MNVKWCEGGGRERRKVRGGERENGEEREEEKEE